MIAFFHVRDHAKLFRENRDVMHCSVTSRVLVIIALVHYVNDIDDRFRPSRIQQYVIRLVFSLISSQWHFIMAFYTHYIM